MRHHASMSPVLRLCHVIPLLGLVWLYLNKPAIGWCYGIIVALVLGELLVIWLARRRRRRKRTPGPPAPSTPPVDEASSS
jgi:hypothetical protein